MTMVDEKNLVGKEGSAETIAWVGLSHFRNYVHLHVELNPGLNLVVGPNAQGKTNFLEAIALLSTSKLLRGQRDEEAIRTGAEEAIAKAHLSHGGEATIRIPRGARKKAEWNGQGLRRPADLIGRIPSVTMSAADLAVVAGEPGERRLFLDLALAQLSPVATTRLAAYKRALEQRNALLRESAHRHVDELAFAPWEERMAEAGEALRRDRREFVEQLGPIAAAISARLGAGELIELSYTDRDEDTNLSLIELLTKNRDSDVRRGSTSSGPHKDDLKILIDSREARLYGSQGQQRSGMIALKMAVFRLMNHRLGRPPLLLLDDMFSDLDENRRRSLTELVLEHETQTVLTCTEPDQVGKGLLSRGRIYRVLAGTMEAL